MADSLGFGLDLRGSRDLLESMAEHTDPNDPLLIAEAAARRLDCPLGGLIDDPLYGHDVRQYLNRGTTDADLMSAAGEIRAQVDQDDRIESATVTVAPGGTPIGSELTITIRVTPADPSVGEFSFVVSVSEAAVLLLEVA